MDRKVPFEVGEFYHLYTRGVEKRIIFQCPDDFDRFMALLLVANTSKKVEMRSMLKKYQGESLVRASKSRFFDMEKGGQSDSHTDIVAYALMPKHVHLLVHERRNGGISKFMGKLLTAYSMFFNTKYERSGPLFTRPYRSKHIDSDEYLRWVFSYIHLNPLEVFQHDWKESGISNLSRAKTFLHDYTYSSFADYGVADRSVSCILNAAPLPIETDKLGRLEELFTHATELHTDDMHVLTR